MASFYGNIKNNSRASFIFDRIYSSRVAMEKALKEDIDTNKAVQGDGVFVNRYVLIDYGYSAEGAYVKIDSSLVQAVGEPKTSKHIVTGDNFQNFYTLVPGETDKYEKATMHYTRIDLEDNGYGYYSKTNFVDRFNYGQLENTYYAINRQNDEDAYCADYDLTVWMKIYSNNEEKYIMVARLSVDPPSMELIVDAPADKNGGAHFDLLQSSDKNYVYHVPNAWYVKLNEYNPEKESTYTKNDDVDGYWEYEYDIENVEDRTYNSEHEYPFYNEAGFDPYIKTVSNEEDEITFNNTKSGRRYLDHRYQVINLTPDTYRRNQYYIKQNDEYLLAVGEFNKNAIYYIKTQAVIDDFQPITLTADTYRRNYYYIPIFKVDENNNETNEISGYVISSLDYDSNQTYYTNIAESAQIDTKRLDISLPSIGNAVSDMYDSLYGQPNEASDYLLGYTDEETANGYETDEDEEHSIPVKIVDPNSGEEKYLTQEEIDKLYHDDEDPHNIPVYDSTGRRRPYTAGQLYKATDIDPYDNIYPNDPISMGWGVYEIKKYLSELRFLAYGDSQSENAFEIVGLTNEDKISEYTEDQDGFYKIENNFYNLTANQENSLSDIDYTYNVFRYNTSDWESIGWLNNIDAYTKIENLEEEDFYLVGNRYYNLNENQINELNDKQTKGPIIMIQNHQQNILGFTANTLQDFDLISIPANTNNLFTLANNISDNCFYLTSNQQQALRPSPVEIEVRFPGGALVGYVTELTFNQYFVPESQINNGNSGGDSPSGPIYIVNGQSYVFTGTSSVIESERYNNLIAPYFSGPLSGYASDRDISQYMAIATPFYRCDGLYNGFLKLKENSSLDIKTDPYNIQVQKNSQIIGYTNSSLKNNYSEVFKINDEYYNLDTTQELIFSEDKRDIPVYMKKRLGLQSDWTLDSRNAFGYIYHKPRLLWSWDEVNFVPPTDGEIGTTIFPLKEDTNYYTQNSIEFIYDHYNDEGLTNSDLFGPNRNQTNWLNKRI